MDANTKRIADTYNIVVRDNPKKSTEWHFNTTAQKLWLLYRVDVDADEIEAAVAKAQD